MISNHDKIKQLNPHLDEQNIVKVGGRTSKAGVHYRQQIIIPSGKVAQLLVRHVHEANHMGCEYTLAQIREKYWIRRKDVKGVIRKCITCEKINGRPCQQKMGDLPTSRLAVGDVPFTNTGVDCFGPFLIKRGRSEVKRYGCLFTCMTTRAIHIEVLESLDTDSFLNALRRIISRRGQPRTITSDNGGNFVSACKELKQGLLELDQAKIDHYMIDKGVEWIFHPPHASHKSGIWERQIRSTRKVLAGLLRGQKLCEETLVTLMCEVESILNNRPITQVSDELNDLKVLKPSHLLLLREAPLLPPCMSDEKDIYRRRWRQVQHLAHVFWKG